MFAKLRPHHRRSGSTPTSPSPNQIPPGFLQPPPNSSHGHSSMGARERESGSAVLSPASVAGSSLGAGAGAGAGGQEAMHVAESPVSPMPPLLPPIPRVASVYGKGSVGVVEEQGSGMARMQQGGGGGGGVGLGLQVQTEQLHRIRSRDSQESRSSGSPILTENFARYEHEPVSKRVLSAGSVASTGDGQAPRLQSPPVIRREGVSESEFRSILQGKHLPPLPNSAGSAASSTGHRSINEIASPPPVPLSGDSHQVYSRPAPPSQSSFAPSTRQGSSSNLLRPGSEHRGSKNKLHLLNPMSLLLRRRNGQMLDHLSEEALVTHRNPSISPLLPDDFDPRIRGNTVHDFSAPRPRRNFSSQDITERERKETVVKDASRKLSDDHRHERQHTPVFREHFEDDEKAESALRAEALANSDFVTRNSFPAGSQQQQEERISPMPPFARVGRQTVYKPPDVSVTAAAPPPAVSEIPSPPPPPVPEKDNEVLSQRQSMPLSPLLEDPPTPDPDATPKKRESKASTIRQSIHQSTSKRTPPSARSSRISRSSVTSDYTPSGLPSHMFSRASRFSFQYANTDSANQERMLEEKHREKQAKADAERVDSPGRDEEEDEFDYDDMDLDGMEDDVPIAGEAWDYGGGLGIGNMTLESMGGGGLGSMSMDDMDDYGEDDDFGGGGLGNMTLDDMPTGGLGNMTIDSFSKSTSSQRSYNPLRDNPVEAVSGAEQASTPEHDGSTNMAPAVGQADTSTQLHAATTDLSPAQAQKAAPIVDSFIEPSSNENEFYFDDGEFDDADFIDEVNAFDESVFDDPSHPLYERQSAQLAPPPIPRKSSSRNRLRDRSVQPLGPSESLPVHPEPDASIDMVTAYHSALAMAATKAAADGRFERVNSIAGSEGETRLPVSTASLRGGDDDQAHATKAPEPDLSPSATRFSQDSSTLSPPTARASGALAGDQLDALNKSVNFMLPSASPYHIDTDAYTSDFDYSDYDSTFENDPMIAAANAEALENDDEGLYGSEFGFYARPGASADDSDGGSVESVYGGYFGPKNWGEIKRQRSTREPNLTPITERSEYSTRNSFIGVGFAEHERNAAGQSPGLAALARMSPGWGEGDMSMETLLKLRRGAWGGSQGSVGSSPMNSSPIVAHPDNKRPQLWSSSPMSRTMTMDSLNVGAEADDEYDEDEDDELVGEVNYDDDDEENDGSFEISPEDTSPPSESPTLRAQPPSSSSADSSVSPILLSQPPHHPFFTFPAQPLSPATTATSSYPPTLATSTPLITTSNLQPHSQRSSYSPISPLASPTQTHKRSGSDSVAYVREKSEEGGEIRWVLERRRTGEDGVESLVERRRVEGGRI